MFSLPRGKGYEIEYIIYQLRTMGYTKEDIDNMTYAGALKIFMFRQYDNYCERKNLEK
jgi:hypothetical protein